MTASRRPAAGETGAAREASPRRTPDIGEVLLEVHRQLDLRDQLRVLLSRAAEWVGARAGFAFGPAEERPRLVAFDATVPRDDPRYRALPRLDRDRLAQWLRGAPLRAFEGLGPLAERSRPWPGEAGAASLLLGVAPPSGSAAGAIWLILDRPASETELTGLTTLLERARPAVANALQVEAMRELVIKDDTASCFNRRYFEEFLPEELSRAQRFKAPVSLIFFDLDNLKEVNNAHGHAAGSRTLNEVSLRVRGKVRKFDKLFRFGGDEFCIVLPETEWHGALEVAERVREAIAGSPFLTEGRQPAGGVRITASFGIASFPLHARNKESLIQQADRAMQQVKRRRKNAVGVAEIVGDEHGG